MPSGGRHPLGLALASLLALAACQTDRVIQGIGPFGHRYSEVVSRPWAFGGGEFCASTLSSNGSIWYEMYVRAPAAECAVLAREFDTRSNSRDAFAGRTDVLNCIQTGAYACERAMQLQRDLSEQYGTPTAEAAGTLNREALDRFFHSNGRLLTHVLFGFDDQPPLSLECARFMRQLDDDGYESIVVIACRDGSRARIVDVVWEAI